MPLVNPFRIGADPEFAIVSGGHLMRATFPNDNFVPWGIDHGGYVVEPHPKPELSVRQLIENLKVSFNDFASRPHPEGKWLAGPVVTMQERIQCLGGHVHIDQPRCSQAQMTALDLFTQHLEKLDILPGKGCEERRNRGDYGLWSDIRNEHGHYEYRTPCSWLFSQRVTKICLLGIKLTAVDAAAPKEVLGDPTKASKTKLRAFFERFKGKDDDVDWLLNTAVLSKNLNVKHDRDLKDVWRVEPKAEDPHWKTIAGVQVQVPPQRQPNFLRILYPNFLRFADDPNVIGQHNIVEDVTGHIIGKYKGDWPQGVAFDSIRVQVNGIQSTWHVALPANHLSFDTVDEEPMAELRRRVRNHIINNGTRNGLTVVADCVLVKAVI
jgi:hypothetical protein